MTGIRTNYRPNHVFEYIDGQVLTTYIGEVKFNEPDIILPGEEENVIIRFLFVEELNKFLTLGRKWWLHEGGRKVGEATITKI